MQSRKSVLFNFFESDLWIRSIINSNFVSLLNFYLFRGCLDQWNEERNRERIAFNIQEYMLKFFDDIIQFERDEQHWDQLYDYGR